MVMKFLDMLKRGVVLFDGAMGTMLYERGIFINRCFDEVNLSRPELVESIHREYVDAGAQVIETNTFGANRVKLKLHGFDNLLEEINIAGVEIARKASDGRALVAGSIGPLGIKIEPWGPTSNEEAREFFKEQAKALLKGGVDLFILETFADSNEIHQAILAVKEVSDLPIVAQMTIQEDGLCLYGTECSVFAGRLQDWGADVVGVNCSVGPKITLEAVEKILAVVDVYVSAQPNAGIPQNVEGRNIYLVSPEYLAEYARRFVQVGVRVVGGCCGTTPEHIKAMRNAIKSIRPHTTHAKPKPVVVIGEKEKEPIPLEERSALAKKIVSGKPIRIVEVLPPRGCSVDHVLEIARNLKSKGLDAINIPDSPRASSRMSPIALAVLIENEAGIETILHYCCRDRNMLGIQSDLLGAHALGLRNLLLITGDPVRKEDYPDATSVFDIDSIGLTNVVSALNRGKDIGGRSLNGQTSFVVGVGVNPGAINFEQEMRRFYWKVEAGAEFAITQPVFDIRQFEKFLEAIQDIRIPIIAGIWPLSSYRNAEFLNNELPGVSVPENILKRMKEAGTGDKALAEGVKIAIEILEELESEIDGIQVSAPFGKYDRAVEVAIAFRKGR